MIDASSQTDVRSQPLLPLSTRLGPVYLAVTERSPALAIWRDVVGLEVLSENGAEIGLGVGGRELLVLETGAARPVAPQSLGLYHVALHLPERRHLAQFVARALAARVRIAPTDHLVSEAVYLWDADGNGIEITFETPSRGSLGNPDTGVYAVTADGRPHSGREPIDLDDLMGELGPDPVPAPTMPAGTRVGHIHLHVPDLEEAMRFYRDGLGFGGVLLIRSFGMGDVGLGYMPHSIAFNIWAGARAVQPPPGHAGLRQFAIQVPDTNVLAGVEARLRAQGVRLNSFEGGFETADPAGNRLRLQVAAA